METLRLVRALLSLKVAFISELRDGRRVFRYVDSQGEIAPVSVRVSNPLEESYCERKRPSLAKLTAQQPVADLAD